MQRITAILIALVTANSLYADCGETPALACPSTTLAASLSSSSCLASDNSFYDLWQFSGSVGQTVTIDLHSSAFDSYLILLDSSGKPVAENDDAVAGVTDSRITFTLSASGPWSVVANSLAPGQSGQYTLSLACPTSGPRRRSATH